MRKPNQISVRHALDPDELEFCRIYAAFGYQNHTEAYRRAFFPKIRDETGKRVEHPEMPTAKNVNAAARRLLDTAHIQAYLEELRTSTGEIARDVLRDHAQFGDDQASARAAIKILEQEDKLGARDATLQWAELMCAIGTEVVVPLPGGSEVSVPFSTMLPQYADAMPPADVLTKTIRALEAYRDAQAAKDTDDAL